MDCVDQLLGDFSDFNTSCLNSTNCSASNISTTAADNATDNATTTTSQASDTILSLEQHEYAKYVLYFYVLPIIAIIGVVGNGMSISVLQLKNRTRAFNIYLTALTSADILLLLLAGGRCLVLIIARYPRIQYPAFYAYGEYYLSLALGTLLQRISNSLISLIAIERFVAVAFPFKVKSLSIEEHPIKWVVGVVLYNLLCQIPTWVLLCVTQEIDAETNMTVYGIGARYQTSASTLARKVYLVFLSVVTMFIPLIIVFSSSVAILIFLRVRSNASGLGRTIFYATKERETMTLTLVAMSAIFTLCYIPAIAIYVFGATNRPLYMKEIHLVLTLVDINIVCVCFNSASDFLMYVLSSRQFRTMFAHKFFSCLQMRRAADLSSSSAGSFSADIGSRKQFSDALRTPETSPTCITVSSIAM